MQFIEKNSFNVRSAIYYLKKDGKGPEFLLFPMIHVGSKEYFHEVSQRLASCDLVLVEGVESKRASLLTLSYRFVRNIKRMNLVTQQEGLKVSDFQGKIFNSDMTEMAFEERWSSLPVGFRIQLVLLLPIYAAHFFLSGTRETLAKNIALEDLPSPEEILSSGGDDEKLDELLIDERDRKLIETIKGLQASGQHDTKLIGVVYGARHMRNVVNFLLKKLNYRVAKGDWVTVFDL